MKRLKICRVGTAPSSMLLIRQQLVELSAIHDVTVICSSRDRYAEKSVTFQDLKLPPNIRHINFEIPRNVSPLRDLRALVKLFQVFRREKFDVVHSIMPKAGLLVAIASFLARVPVRLHTFTGQRWLLMNQVPRWLFKQLDRLVVQLNTKSFADSLSQARFLQSESIGNSIEVIGQGSIAGVDRINFNVDRVQTRRDKLRESLGYQNSDVVALFVGRLTPDKGISELFEAFQQTPPDLKLMLIGTVEPLLNLRYPGLFEKLIGSPRVQHFNFCPDLAEYMFAADFLILPSYREGFGNVVIEAAMLGRPTLGTKIYGLTDAVVDQITGELVPPQNAEELKRKLIEWGTDREKISRLGREARRRAEQMFDSTVLTAALAREYHNLSSQNLR